MQLYLIDDCDRLVSGPHPLPSKGDPASKGGIITEHVPPTPSEGEVVFHSGAGKWKTAPDVVLVEAPEQSLPTLTHLEFLRLLRPEQTGRWRRRVKAALDAETPTEMDDVIVAADQHFSATKAVEMEHPDTKAALYIMYAEGAFGPFYDGTGEPSPEQLEAIAEADRVGRAEQPA